MTLDLSAIERQIAELQAAREAAIQRDKIETVRKVEDVLSHKPIESIMELVTKFLNQVGTTFEIKMPDGTTYQSKLDPKHAITRKGRTELANYPRGEVANFIKEQLEQADLDEGDDYRLDLGKYDINAVKKAACQVAYTLYGKGKYATRTDGEKQVWVERLG